MHFDEYGNQTSDRVDRSRQVKSTKNVVLEGQIEMELPNDKNFLRRYLFGKQYPTYDCKKEEGEVQNEQKKE